MNDSLRGHHGLWIISLILGCWLTAGVTCPLKCQCLNNLYVYCDNQEILDDSLDDIVSTMPKTTTYIDLSDNLLTKIQSNIFLRFNDLLDVDLSNNRVENISLGVFKNLPSLQKIHLHGNELTRLHNDSFYNLRFLKEVNLHNNQISAIDMCAFSHVPLLQKVNLNNNIISNLTANCLLNFKHVKHLDMSYNEISVIADGAFSKLVNLTTLSLSHNQISSISVANLQGLSALENLHLDFNNIKILNRYTFDHFRTKLKRLTLSSNEIGMLNSGVFMGMIKLEVLDLSFNQMYTLGSNVFQGLSLSALSLKGNKLNEITQYMLSGTRRIENLDLSWNEIMSISARAFESFKDNIYHLNLQSNSLGNVLVGVFDGMKNLQSLNLANNSISFIENGAFRDLVNLKRMDLSSNRLSIVTSEMFSGTTSLQHMDLQSNPVRKFQGDQLVRETNIVVRISLNLTVLELKENSVLLKWPYIQGSQIYWSLYVTCIEAESCPFRPQPQSLPPYQEDVTITNLSPLSIYYVCVNPAFVSDNIDMQQCVFIVTPGHVIEETTDAEPITQAATSKSSMFNCQDTSLPIISLFISFFLLS